jgi:hypothetical protein
MEIILKTVVRKAYLVSWSDRYCKEQVWLLLRPNMEVPEENLCAQLWHPVRQQLLSLSFGMF